MCTNPITPLPDEPLITIVVACLNQEAYIAETISSVLDQDYENIELIVVDGGSTDNSVEIIRTNDSDPRFRWISEPDNGPLSAYHKGIALATGNLIGLQSSSDTYEPGALREAVEEFAADSKLAFIGGGVAEVDAEGRRLGPEWMPFVDRHYYSIDDLVTLTDYPPLQSTFFRREIGVNTMISLLEAKWIHVYFFLQCMMEVASLEYRSLFVPRHWGNYRRHTDALSKELSTLAVGLAVILERNIACEKVSLRQRRILSPSQTQKLLRPGYIKEFKYRVGTLHQTWPAIPALWNCLRTGSWCSWSDLRPHGKSILSHVMSIGQAVLSDVRRLGKRH